jgi:two-component system C4-dicarboxylate transport sensor histidine kinase DctB
LGGIGLEEPVAVDVNAVARAAAEVATGPVELDLATPLPRARGSRPDLCVALEALLANAREAAGPGATVRLLSRVDGDSIVVSVEDSGPGVAAAARQRNFDPFFSTKGGKGRGIGLTIAALVAASYRGELTVEDRREAAGTLASLRLPSV